MFTDYTHIGRELLMRDICDAQGKIAIPFIHITSPINYDPNRTKKVKIVSEHNPAMASRWRSHPTAAAHVVGVAEYARDVATTTGNSCAFKSIETHGAFADIAEAESHALEVVERLAGQTPRSRSEEHSHPAGRVWTVWQGRRHLYSVAISSVSSRA